MLLRPSGKMKPKCKARNECTSSNSNYTTTSDDIWMKNWGYDSQDMFEAAKEAEMSVSDPEEYLVSRSDEDSSLYSQHNDPNSTTVTLNSEQHALLGSRDEEDYVTSIEFNECIERGLFCREFPDSHPVLHYHCPCCIKHSETSVIEIEHHYRECVSNMSTQHALFTSICKHDHYITFQECKTSDPDCPARAIKLPIHYHCPCCLIFTQQNIGQVVRHQLTCCKTLGMLQPCQVESSPMSSHQSVDNMCTHDPSTVKFKLCFSPYCIEDDMSAVTMETASRKHLHFHCMCCNMYIDKQLRSLRKHQRLCCVYSSFSDQCELLPKVMFLLETSAALQQHIALEATQSRKRALQSLNTDPMAVLSSSRKVPKRASAVLLEIDSALFSKCMESSNICSVNERNRTAHYHCPICKVYTSRRLPRVKLHYSKCSKPKARAKPRGQPLDLQVELVDKLNRIFLVRGSNQGPGLPCHVIYRAGTNSNVMNCENGCKMDKNMSKIRCKHLEACEEFVRNTDDLVETGADAPPLNQISLFYSFDDNMKNAVFLLAQTCAEQRVPIIRPYYPVLSTNNSKSVYIYYSVSACTSPQFVSKCGRVVVTYNEQSQTFKCKCGCGSACVHVHAAQLYHSHYLVNSMLCEETLEKGRHYTVPDDESQSGFSGEGCVKYEENDAVVDCFLE